MTDPDPYPIFLRPTLEARALGQFRYDRAYSFLPKRDPRSVRGYCRFLRDAGLTANLGLLSYLNTLGFDDDWCVRTIGSRPAIALHYANRYGLGHDRPDMERLADLLSPYRSADRSGIKMLGDLLCPVWLWNRLHHRPGDTAAKLDLSSSHIRALLIDLLQHVGLVTGHGTPRREQA